MVSMATRGRLSSGCPFQLCTAPALASQPPCSLSLSPASPTISSSLHPPSSLPFIASLPLLSSPHLPPSCDRGSHTHTHLLIIHTTPAPLSEPTCTVTVFLCRHYNASTMNPCAQPALHFLSFPSPPIPPPPTTCTSSGLS